MDVDIDFWFSIAMFAIALLGGSGALLYRTRRKIRAMAELLTEVADSLEDEKITREEVNRIAEKIRRFIEA